MPLLGSLLIGLCTLLFNVFGRFMVFEKAFRLAAVLSMLVLITALVLAMRSCVTGVCGAAISGMSVSSPNFAVGLGIAFNSITFTAASCYISVWTICQLYIIKKRMVSLVVGG